MGMACPGGCGCGDGGCVHAARGVGAHAAPNADGSWCQEYIDDLAADEWLSGLSFRPDEEPYMGACMGAKAQPPPVEHSRCLRPRPPPKESESNRAVSSAHRWFIYGSKAVGMRNAGLRDYYMCRFPGCNGRLTRTTHASGEVTHTVTVEGPCTVDLQLPPQRSSKRMRRAAERLSNARLERRHGTETLANAHRLLDTDTVGI